MCLLGYNKALEIYEKFLLTLACNVITTKWKIYLDAIFHVHDVSREPYPPLHRPSPSKLLSSKPQAGHDEGEAVGARDVGGVQEDRE